MSALAAARREARWNPFVVERHAGPPRRWVVQVDGPWRGRSRFEGTQEELERIDPILAQVVRGYERRSWDIPGLGEEPAVMGIVNVTPDSFSDGGRFFEPAAAIEHGERLAREGAAILDVGGESTRPGSGAVPVREELRRVLPVVEALAGRGHVVSVDTRKAKVAREALAAGARIVNDVSGLRHDPGMAETVAQAGAAVVVMHMRGTPHTMARRARYGDVVREVAREIRGRIVAALQAGIPRDRILVDPGIGFAKMPEHNLEILRRLEVLRSLGAPLVVGPSRKSFLGHCLGRPVGERLMGTAAAVAAAVLRGAAVVRVHDVGAMRDVVRLCARMV